MSKEQLPANEPTHDQAQRSFIRNEIELRHLASYIPPSCKEIMTDVILDIRKVRTKEDIFAKAGEFDVLMGYEDNRYERSIRSDYDHYTAPSRPTKRDPEKDAVMRLRGRVAFELSKYKLIQETEEKRLRIGRDILLKSAQICVELTRKQESVIIPDPKYL